MGMATPVILGTLSYTVMQFADNYFVGQLGPEPLAAVGSAGIWAVAIAAFFMGVVGCVATFVSQSIGRGKPQDSAPYAWQGVYISIVGGLGALLLWPLVDVLFNSMGHAPEVARMEAVYFRIRLLGFVFIAWQVALTSFFQAVSRASIPMAAAFAANALNFVLDPLLIFGIGPFPEWGVAGAAAATSLAIFVQAVLLQAVFLSRGFHEAYGTRTSYSIDRVKLRQLVRIGWPGGFSFMMDVLNWAIFTSFMVGRYGNTNELAAHTITMTFIHLSFMPVVGLSHALTPIVGQWIGRKDIPTAKSRTHTSLKLGVPYMAGMGLVYAVFGPQLIRIFFPATPPEVVVIGAKLLLLAAVFQGFDAVNIVMIGALRGVGDTTWMMRAMISLGYFFFLPVAWVLALSFESAAVGAWVGATVYIIGLACVLFWRFQGERWRDIQIFETGDAPAPEV
jgi:MATE family multidrug resistance protein